MTRGAEKLLVAAAVLALAAPLASIAAGEKPPAASDQAGAGVDRMIKTESQQRMNMNEPMPTGMAKKGMKKGDVKAHARKKEAVLDEMMKKEEMKR